MEMNRKNNRGVLLTLVTIILVVLMLAEIITYVYLNIQYNNVSSFDALSSANYRFAISINSESAVFLRTSLSSAITVLAGYELAKQGNAQINNTAYQLESLMYNGKVYGSNEIAAMEGDTLVNFTNSLISQARSQQINLTIQNGTISVYQTGPYTINVSYVALAIINSSAGRILYPINQSYQLLLKGAVNLYVVQSDNNFHVKISGGYPSAVLVGGAYAEYASTSPFQFVYGPVIVENTLTSCAGIPAQFENNNYILAVQNSLLLQGTCGFGGFIGYAASSNSVRPDVPYLLYGPGSNVFNYINSGSSLLLDGNGLELLNLSSTQVALHTNYFYNSSFSPSYLHWGNNNVSSRDPFGIFTLGLYNRLVPQFVSSSGNFYLQTTDTLFSVGAGGPPQHVSLSLWFLSRAKLYSTTPATGLAGENALTNILGLEIKGTKLLFGSDDGSCSNDYITSTPINNTVTPYTWHNVVAVYNSTGGNYIYLDGVQVANGIAVPCTASGTAEVTIGKGDSNDLYFNGSLSNVQFYNISLSRVQASKLYYQGVESAAANTLNLTAWWTLNGATIDYSGYGRTLQPVAATQNSIWYKLIYAYSGDPIYGGSFYSANQTNLVQGVYNCANLNQCSNMTAQHLYLAQTNLSTSTGSALTEAGTFGLGNAVIPNVASFNGNGFFFSPVNSITFSSGSEPFSISEWVYLDANTIGPIMDVASCDPVGGSCGNKPFVSVNTNTIYLTVGATTKSYTAPSLNSWYNIILTYSPVGTTSNLYVNGVQQLTESTAYGSIGPPDYFTTDCNLSLLSPCILPGGVSKIFYGKMGDLKIMLTALTASQANQIYTNDTLEGTPGLLSDSWSLTTPYNGLVNQTADSVNSLNPGYIGDGQGICPNSNMIIGQCGVEYTQP